jgi:PIN domain nuclease of toxin-antitoxin system
MRLLLDTHFALWWLSASRRLGRRAQTLIQDSDSAVSVASLIESRMLALAGKARVPDVASIANQLEQDGIPILALETAHVAESMRFELSHTDIFDRLLLGTAAASARTLLTRDSALLALAESARLRWVLEG